MTKIGFALLLAVALRETALSQDLDAIMKAYDLPAYVLKLQTGGPTADTQDLQFSPDERWLVGAGYDRTVRIWDISEVEQNGFVDSCRSIHLFCGNGGSGQISSIRFSPNSRILAVAANQGETLVDVATGEVLSWPVSLPDDPRKLDYCSSVAFSADSRYLATGHSRSVSIFDLASFWKAYDAGELVTLDQRRVMARQLLADSKSSDWQPEQGVFSLEFVEASGEPLRLVAASLSPQPTLFELRGDEWVRAADLNGHNLPTPRVAASPSGRTVFTAGFDQEIRRWNHPFRQSTVFAKSTYAQEYPTSLKLPKDGSLLLAAPFNAQFARECVVFDTSTGRKISEFSLHTNSVTASAFHPTADLVATAAAAAEIYLWKPSNGKLVAKIEGLGSDLLSVAFSTDGKRLAFGNQLTDLQAIAPQEKQRFQARYSGLYGVPGTSQFALDHAFRPLSQSFDLEKMVAGQPVTDGEADSTNWHRAQLSLNGWSARTPTNMNAPAEAPDITVIVSRGRQEVTRITRVDRLDKITAFGFVEIGAQRQMGIVIASRSMLTLHNAETGSLLRSFKGHEAPVRAVATSPDGSLLASAGSDQTVRVWSLNEPGEWLKLVGIQFAPGSNVAQGVVPGGAAALAGIQAGDVIESVNGKPVANINNFSAAMAEAEDNAEVRIVVRRGGTEQKFSVKPRRTFVDDLVNPLVSIFSARNGQWVAWTTPGFYTSSPQGDSLFGWQVNKGFENAADFYPAASFQAALYRPDFVKAYLASHGDPAVLPPSLSIDQLLVSSTPPIVRIQAPSHNSSVDRSSAELVVDVTHLPELPVQAINVTVNGKVARALTVAPLRDGNRTFRQSVELSRGLNRIGVQAVGPGGILSEPQTVQLQCTSPEAPDLDSGELPDLYVLAVGVSEHTDRSLNLRFAAKDADDFAQIMNLQQGARFKSVQVMTLTNNAATRANVLAELEHLRKLTIRPNDFVVVFLSGHGAQDERQDYCFVTTDTLRDSLSDSTVRWSEFDDTLRKMKGTSFLMLDTCHAGAATGDASITDASRAAYNDVLREAAMDRSGVITFASCLPHETSLENPEWGNGAFTKALIEAFSGKADVNHNDVVTISELEAFVSGRVEELTSRRQSSSLFKSISVPSNLKLVSLRGKSEAE